MSCRVCHSENRGAFESEISIHLPGLKNLRVPTVLAFPKLLVCLECGRAEFRVEKTELRQLAEASDAERIVS
jgi:hypothetical protein